LRVAGGLSDDEYPADAESRDDPTTYQGPQGIAEEGGRRHHPIDRAARFPREAAADHLVRGGKNTSNKQPYSKALGNEYSVVVDEDLRDAGQRRAGQANQQDLSVGDRVAAITQKWGWHKIRQACYGECEPGQ
jgi:hypothetical protein